MKILMLIALLQVANPPPPPDSATVTVKYPVPTVVEAVPGTPIINVYVSADELLRMQLRGQEVVDSLVAALARSKTYDYRPYAAAGITIATAFLYRYLKQGRGRDGADGLDGIDGKDGTSGDHDDQSHGHRGS